MNSTTQLCRYSLAIAVIFVVGGFASRREWRNAEGKGGLSRTLQQQHAYTEPRPQIPPAKQLVTGQEIRADEHEQGSVTEDRTAPRFIFLSGVAGTGHHLYETLVTASPSFANVVAHDLFLALKALSRKLFNENQKENGLWSAICSDTETNGEERFEVLVKNLVWLNDDVQRINSEGLLQSGAIPIPAVPLNSVTELLYMSYPMGYAESDGPCTILQQPRLSSLFAACDRAGVRCEMVVAHRNPYDVIKSTTMIRSFDSKTKYIQTLSLMLDRMRAQLLDNPGRVAACWDYDASEDDFREIGRIFGWDDMQAFSNFFTDVFVPRQPLSEKERLEVVGPELQIYMDTMVKAMDNVRDLCRQLTRQL